MRICNHPGCGRQISPKAGKCYAHRKDTDAYRARLAERRANYKRKSERREREELARLAAREKLQEVVREGL